MIWQIRDVDPQVKGRIKARAALHNVSIAEELRYMEDIVTNAESNVSVAAQPQKAINE